MACLFQAFYLSNYQHKAFNRSFPNFGVSIAKLNHVTKRLIQKKASRQMKKSKYNFTKYSCYLIKLNDYFKLNA